MTEPNDAAAEPGIPRNYPHGPDSSRRDGVPRGRIEGFAWNDSAVFPGTTRIVQVYIPAQYSGGELAALMVFQDGQMYLDPDLEMRAGIVFDNLIHDGSMPTTIGVFVDPGQLGNRNAEYDPADDRYAEFLITEIIPAVRDQLGLNITEDPDLRAICGGSSGGNCAFTVAWQRPDRFGLVLGFVSSFAQIPGGNPYPELIRRTSPKPLRVFLQANRWDLNFDHSDLNWYSNNLLVAAALAENGYDHRIELGDGAHNANHGGVILPDALRWLWRT
ncbi:alpha/beta hydrolase-fold protein [Nakamurella sp. A5-74]|uniref:Alpha/beta hydrolase-fold protein n=1 Tax=Nakamurella sp. A5-74 TaxID=3158264 RepID=A0AAU8DMN8_9ACTN